MSKPLIFGRDLRVAGEYIQAGTAVDELRDKSRPWLNDLWLRDAQLAGHVIEAPDVMSDPSPAPSSPPAAADSDEAASGGGPGGDPPGGSSAGEPGGSPVDATEAAVRIAEENGIDLPGVEGTGANGRITAGDVKRALRDYDGS